MKYMLVAIGFIVVLMTLLIIYNNLNSLNNKIDYILQSNPVSAKPYKFDEMIDICYVPNGKLFYA